VCVCVSVFLCVCVCVRVFVCAGVRVITRSESVVSPCCGVDLHCLYIFHALNANKHMWARTRYNEIDAFSILVTSS
jgi:hypothetical protein